MVVGVGDHDGIVARHDHAVVRVPCVCEATVGGHVAVRVVCECLRRLRHEDLARDGVHRIGNVGSGRVDGGVDFEVGVNIGRSVVRVVAAVEVRAGAGDGALVDRDEGVGVGLAARGGIAGDGARSVLIERVRRVG